MKEKKHIDRLFQERFKDFEVAPSDAVWENIETQLNKKNKKRRIIPIWWRYAGVAALLLLLLTVGGIYFNNDTVIPSNQVVDTKDSTLEKPSSTTDFNEIKKETNNIISGTNENNTLEPDEHNLNQLRTNVTSPSSAIANTISEPSSSKTTNSNTDNSNAAITKKPNSSKEPFVDNANALANTSKDNTKTESAVNNPESSTKQTNEKNKLIKNTTSEIAAVKKETVDSATIAKPDENKLLTIEEALAKAKNLEEEEKPEDKWSIAPNAAPVYFNSLGKGSSIDSQFNDNSKSGEVNMSYGVTASYAVTKKLKIRSGINKVNLGYNTNDVVVFESIGITSKSSSLIKNISTNDAPQNISLISGESLGDFKNESFIQTSNTSINQSLGYIEVPLEIEYAIVNNKFGVNVIGGFSSFFLNNNKLYSEFEGGKTLIGEATNLNKVSYSANFGLGLNYKMTKKFELNLEPLFKYQINTFNNTSGNFKPYFIGVYTGIGFKF